MTPIKSHRNPSIDSQRKSTHQSAFNCSKLTIKTLEQGVKYFTPCSSVFIVNFGHGIAGWERGAFLLY